MKSEQRHIDLRRRIAYWKERSQSPAAFTQQERAALQALAAELKAVDERSIAERLAPKSRTVPLWNQHWITGDLGVYRAPIADRPPRAPQAR